MQASILPIGVNAGMASLLSTFTADLNFSYPR